MSIPSYDDLTPSIPDVSSTDMTVSAARLLSAADLPAEAASHAVGPVAAASNTRCGFRLPAEGSRPADLPAEAASHGSLETGTHVFACLRAPRASEAIGDIARDFSPRIERHGEGCIVLDVSGLGGLIGDPPAIGNELQRAAAERDAAIRVAIAPTQTAALLLTLAHATLIVVTSGFADALADIPLVHLQQLVADAHGVTLRRGSAVKSATEAEHERNERAFDVLRRWGLTTLGELAALPPADLSARMGQAGLRLQQLARGADRGPLVPDPAVPRFIERMELEWPIDTLEPLSFVLARLLDPLAAALERADRAAAAIRLDLRLVDRTTHTRMLQLPAPMRDPRVLRTLLLLDLESHPPSAAIDVVTVETDPAPGRVVQYSLLERALPSAETIATLTARLGALVGESRCGSPELLDTHRPDAFEMRRFAPSTRPSIHASGDAPRQPTAVSDRTSTHRLAATLTPVLRRFRAPVAVRVTVERGRPVHVAIDRRGMPGGDVAQGAGPWRSSGAWWDRPASHWNRDEWDVALSDGSACRLFHDRDTEQWFLDGVLD
jgi:protein ImuB